MSSTGTLVAMCSVPIAAGLLAAPAQAQPRVPFPQAPGCSRYEFTGDQITFNLDNGVRIVVPWDPASKRNPNTTYSHLYNGGDEWQGPAGGGLNPGARLEIDITWIEEFAAPFGGPGSLTGDGGTEWRAIPPPARLNRIAAKIDPNSEMAVNGSVINEKGAINTWTSDAKFSCIDVQAPAAPAPAEPEPADPAPAPDKPTICTFSGVLMPAGQPCPKRVDSAKITEDVDIYSAPGGEGEPFGVVPAGIKVFVKARQPDNWVQIVSEEIPGKSGWVWGDFVGS